MLSLPIIMTLESIFSHRAHHKSTPASLSVIADNFTAETWHYLVSAEPTRLVRKVKLCTALATGRDTWDEPVDKDHLHTFLMVSLVSTLGFPDDVYLVERILSTGDPYHSVTPIEDGFLSTGGSLSHPNVYDQICVVPEAQLTALAHHLEIERTLVFSDGPSAPSLTLAEFAEIVAYISRTTMLMCTGGDCKFQSRSFAFTCLSALTPTLPPAMGVHEGAGMDSKHDTVGDLVFERLSAEFLERVPWLVRDPEALRVMSSLRGVNGGCDFEEARLRVESDVTYEYANIS